MFPDDFSQVTMDKVDVRPEHRAELAELTIQKELYLTLVLKLQELTDTVKPNLEALYAVKIGHKELDLLQKQAEVAGLKYKLELLIACINSCLLYTSDAADE